MIRTRYVVLEEIGRGGMGRVLRAYDPKLQREVALKEVRRKLLGLESSRRLVAEARAMAKLSHPHVVAVYDVEDLDEGEVVLVMEYVDGQTLGAWLQVARTWQEIVGCFRRAGAGLAAAHAAGLLHRDFKPDNVLIGASEVVKVTDFGLAKTSAHDTGTSTSDFALASDASSDGLTETGVVLGTPRYMAPEQHRGEPLTPAADQYAYCVALWEALTGTPPFDHQGPDRIEPAKESGPPPWPGGSTPSSIAAAIVRGLAPDPHARWPDMHALLAALSVDPARRRRRWLQAAAALSAVAVAAFTVQAWASAREQRCTDAAARVHLEGAWDETRRTEVHDAVLGIGAAYTAEVATRTDEALERYASAWTRKHVETCEATTVHGEQSADVMDLRMGCLHRAKVELAAVTDLLAHADASTVQKAHELLSSLRPLERCDDVDALRAEVEPPLPEEAEAVEAVRERLATSRAALRAARQDDARAALDEARGLANDLRYGPLHTEVALGHGLLLRRAGQYDDASVVLQEALRLASRWRQWNEMQLVATELLQVVGYGLRRFDEAMRYAEIAEGLAGGDVARQARVLRGIGAVRSQEGKYDEAEAVSRREIALLESLSDADPLDVALAHQGLAIALDLGGDLVDAEAAYLRILGLLETLLGPEHPDVAQCRLNLAAVLYSQGKFAESEASSVRAIAALEAALGTSHPYVATARSGLAVTFDAQGKFVLAEAEHRRALALSERAQGPEHPATSLARHNLAVTLRMLGKYDESETEHRRALAMQEKVLGPDHHHVAMSHNNLALLLFTRGDAAGAEAEYRRALALLESALGTDHPDVATCRTRLAEALLARDAFAEARELAEASWRQQENAEMSGALRADTAFVLARTYWARDDEGDRRRAIEMAERALADYREAGGDEASTYVASVRDWIAARRRR